MDLIVILNLAPAELIIIPVPLFPALHPLPLLPQLLLPPPFLLPTGQEKNLNLFNVNFMDLIVILNQQSKMLVQIFSITLFLPL